MSPALCALFLKNPHTSEGGGNLGERKASGNAAHRFFTAFNAGFEVMKKKYLGSLVFLIRNKKLTYSMLGLLFAIVGLLFMTTPTGFIPDEDGGFVLVSVTTPPGSSFTRTVAALDKASATIRKLPSVQEAVSITGFNILTGSATPSSGLLFVQLKEPKHRGPDGEISKVIDTFNKKLRGGEATCFALAQPTVAGFSVVSGLEFVLQDRTGGSLAKFSDISKGFVGELMKRPEIGFALTNFKTTNPQYELVVDNIKAAQLGVNVNDLMSVMQSFYGSKQASDFNRFGKYYRVVIQSAPGDRAKLASLNGVFVSNSSGNMVPINSLITMKRVFGTETVDHFNLFNAIAINASVKPGFSTGQAIKAVEQVAKTTLPSGYSYDWKGQSREEIESSGGQVVIFSLSLIFVYFLLAALYESYILPFAVMLSIPTGMLGVFIAIKLAGIANNIYVQVAIIMLMGLLAKNAILIVEFSMQRRLAGSSLAAAAIQGAKARLRPILMTALAFIAGLLPLMFVSGPSAMGNHSIGAAAIGGMVFGTMLGIFIIPVLFISFQYLQERLTGAPVPIVEVAELIDEVQSQEKAHKALKS